MANTRWLGRAKDIAQITTATPGGTIGTETFTLTVNGKDVTYTAVGGDAVADVVDGLLAAWQAADDNNPEFADATATDSTTHLTLTSATDGVPFTVTGSATGAATLVVATTTAATGKNHWDNVDNWSAGAVPVSTDNVYIDHSSVSILYGLDQSAVTLTLLDIDSTYTGTIGLPKLNASNYVEYRDDYLKISATTVLIGKSQVGSGSSRIKLNVGANATTVEIFKTGSGAAEVPSFLLLGTHADNAVEIHSGTLGVAIFGGEAATVKTFTQTGGETQFGAGTTLNGAGSTCTLTGGKITSSGAMLTVDVRGNAVMRFIRAATVTTLTVRSGAICYYESSGTAVTVNVYGVVDASADITAKIFTNCTLFQNGRVLDPGNSLTVTNGFILDANVVGVQAF